MNNGYDMIREIVSSWKYRVTNENENLISIRYQMNDICIYPGSDDDNFVSVILPAFSDVTDENYAEVVFRCHKMNEKMKQIKFYTTREILIAAAEFFYMGKADLEFQMKCALNNLVDAKVLYRQMED